MNTENDDKVAVIFGKKEAETLQKLVMEEIWRLENKNNANKMQAAQGQQLGATGYVGHMVHNINVSQRTIENWMLTVKKLNGNTRAEIIPAEPKDKSNGSITTSPDPGSAASRK